VQVDLVSDPTGAEVVRLPAGKALGRTPLSLTLPQGEPPFEIELRAAGRPPIRKTIDGSGSREVKVVFAAPAAKPVKPVKKPPVRKPRPSDDDLLKPPFELE
jgi:hypothetical protein